jgi:hypothetical protein
MPNIRKLRRRYAEEMKLGQPFHPNELLAGKEVVEINKVGAYLETTDTSYQFTITGKAQKIIRNNQPTIDLNFESQSWIKKN